MVHDTHEQATGETSGEGVHTVEQIREAATEKPVSNRIVVIQSSSDPDSTIATQETALSLPQDDGHAIKSITQTDNPHVTYRSESSRMSLKSGMVIAQYELIRQLGRGGMGVVFLARDVRLGRRVAIKFLTDDDDALAERFRAEAQATARCEHDNIVIIHDVDKAHGYSFMVLEYLEGITLRAWLKERWAKDESAFTSDSSNRREALAHPPVSATLAVELMMPVVSALQHAHERGIVHRDLKPENVILTDNGSIKVLDFGIAKVLDEQALSNTTDREFASQWIERDFRTSVGSLVGTMPYMSPEQWSAEFVDERTDVWAVGIMLWELLTGTHPLEPVTQERVRTVRDLGTPMPRIIEKRTDLGALGNIIDGCLQKSLDDRLSTSDLLSALRPFLPRYGFGDLDGQTDEMENPFTGLAAFQESDATRFFGREHDVASLVSRVRHHRFITVAGPSGAGKSSFIRAGVIPMLKRLDGHWRAFVVRPGRRPLAALANVLLQLPGTEVKDEHAERSSIIEQLNTEPGSLGARLRAYCRGTGHRVLLFVDQFEELYTLTSDSAERLRFTACLEGVADDASSPLRVLLSLRADFLERVADDREFMSAIARGLVILSPLARDGLRQALTRPLESVGYRFQTDAMVESMLDTLESTRCPLPLLQFTATKLWDVRERERRELTQDSYDAMGGVAGALATHADSILAGLSAREQQLARAVFTELVTDERTRAIVNLDELRALAPDEYAQSLDEVVRRLADARLVLIQADADRGSTVELSHESLITRWPRLARWLDENQEEATFRSHLRTAAREWDNRERSEDLLWRGQAADDANRWLARWRAQPDGETARASERSWTEIGNRDRDFLLAVIDLAARARRRRRRIAVVGFAFLSIVAVVVSVLAVRASREAARASRETARAKQQTLQTRNAGRIALARERQSDPTLALALVREMEQADQMPNRWRDLARWALHLGVSWNVLTHPDELSFAAFSPDGKRIVTASTDKIARLWRADGSGQPVLFKGHEDALSSAKFSPDGTRILTTSLDKTTRIWAVDDPDRPLVVLRGHEQEIVDATFSPDGKRVVTASSDRTARIWNVDGSGRPIVLRGHQKELLSASFSPDGERVITSSRDQTARVWNADGSGTPQVLGGQHGLMYSATFSPDGKRILVATEKTARIWNLDPSNDERHPPIVLEGHQDIIRFATFSPDGRYVVTPSRDKTVRLWYADGSGERDILHGHQDRVVSAVFSPDGTHILTASVDRTARVWRVDEEDISRATQRRILRGHTDQVHSAVFSPDGATVLTSSRDHTARLWNVSGAGLPRVLRGHENEVVSANFSPDGTQIVTASRDRAVRVWSVAEQNEDGTGPSRVIGVHNDVVYSAAFSPNQDQIVSASFDGTATIWKTDGTGVLHTLRGHADTVWSAAFDPSGTRVVTASNDKTARVWNAATGALLHVLSGHENLVYSAAFSPDGARIVTTSWDRTIRVWRADDGALLGTLRGHTSLVIAGSPGGVGMFSPDGTRIISIANDKTIRRWNIDDLDGDSQPMILSVEDVDPYSVAFSPNGKHVISTSHTRQSESPSGITYTEHSAVIWPNIEPLSGLDDPRLWTTTLYCPTVEERIGFLGISQKQASRQRTNCLERVRQYQTRSRVKR